MICVVSDYANRWCSILEHRCKGLQLGWDLRVLLVGLGSKGCTAAELDLGEVLTCLAIDLLAIARHHFFAEAAEATSLPLGSLPGRSFCLGCTCSSWATSSWVTSTSIGR